MNRSRRKTWIRLRLRLRLRRKYVGNALTSTHLLAGVGCFLNPEGTMQASMGFKGA